MDFDAVVVGAGPNGLSAAIEIARSGFSVCVLEGNSRIGGGVQTAELTLPGFYHDVCSAIYPMGVLSPFFQGLQLKRWGVDWVFSPAALAHPLANGAAAVLYKDVIQTAESLGEDGEKWQKLFLPFTRAPFSFFWQILRPIRIPRRPLMMSNFGMLGLRSCESLAKRFATEKARALFAGCAGHSFLPLHAKGSAAFGLVLTIAAHAIGWPMARGGSQTICDALVDCLRHYGGKIETGRRVRSMQDLPRSRAILFDVTPRQLLEIAGEFLPQSYRRKLGSFRYGPGVFKIDWALNGPVPWLNPKCAEAGTVHVGGTLEEIAVAENDVWHNRHPEKPFVLVAQQSLFDSSRAPAGKQTLWAYCHVPHGSTMDMTDRIETQIERFAPGFRDLILARHTFTTSQLEAHNPNYVGGDITGGANVLSQVLARPFPRIDPYSTANPKIFLCSASTPPGGGVHGMCGYLAAQSAIRKILNKNGV